MQNLILTLIQSEKGVNSGNINYIERALTITGTTIYWGLSIAGFLLKGIFFVLIIAGFILWAMMLVDVHKRSFENKRDKKLWTTVIVITGPVGSLFYYHTVKQPADRKEKVLRNLPK